MPVIAMDIEALKNLIQGITKYIDERKEKLMSCKEELYDFLNNSWNSQSSTEYLALFDEMTDEIQKASEAISRMLDIIQGDVNNQVEAAGGL